jgi:hypothetical protein
MKPKLLLHLALVLTIIALLAGGCGSLKVPGHPSDLPVVCHNPEYNFTFFLPPDWQGYSVLVRQWVAEQPEHGPMIVLRHPQWRADDPYQDIPIEIFTRKQWIAIHQGNLDIGAGGIEEEIGHNRNYVFAISSRFDADDSVKGWKEAGKIVERNSIANPPPLYPE